MARIKILFPTDSTDFKARPDVQPVTPVVQGSTGIVLNLEARNADDSAAFDITAATITGTLRNLDLADTVYNITGTWTIVSGSAGTFTLEFEAADIGVAGKYDFQVKVVKSGETFYSYNHKFTVVEQHSTGVTPTDPLVAIPQTNADLLAALLTLAETAGNAGYHLVLDGDGTISAEAVPSVTVLVWHNTPTPTQVLFPRDDLGLSGNLTIDNEDTGIFTFTATSGTPFTANRTLIVAQTGNNTSNDQTYDIFIDSTTIFQYSNYIGGTLSNTISSSYPVVLKIEVY